MFSYIDGNKRFLPILGRRIEKANGTLNCILRWQKETSKINGKIERFGVFFFYESGQANLIAMSACLQTPVAKRNWLFLLTVLCLGRPALLARRLLIGFPYLARAFNT